MIRTATGLRSSPKRDDLQVHWNSLVVMRLKIQEQRELNFVSRIIQCPLAIGNCPTSVGQGGGSLIPLRFSTGIIRLANSDALRFQNWSLIKKPLVHTDKGL
jgi:hypothetical protein